MFGAKQLMGNQLENRTASLQSSIELSLGAVLNSALNGKRCDDISMLGIELVE